jgi:hypothetical protein
VPVNPPLGVTVHDVDPVVPGDTVSDAHHKAKSPTRGGAVAPDSGGGLVVTVVGEGDTTGNTVVGAVMMVDVDGSKAAAGEGDDTRPRVLVVVNDEPVAELTAVVDAASGSSEFPAPSVWAVEDLVPGASARRDPEPPSGLVSPHATPKPVRATTTPTITAGRRLMCACPVPLRAVCWIDTGTSSSPPLPSSW